MLKSTCFVIKVLNAPNQGKIVIEAIYAPFVKLRYNATKHAQIWDSIIESICNVQLQYHIDAANQVLIGGFNTHIGQNRGGNLPSKTALGRIFEDY